jgi:hypothetical protein
MISLGNIMVHRCSIIWKNRSFPTNFLHTFNFIKWVSLAIYVSWLAFLIILKAQCFYFYDTTIGQSNDHNLREKMAFS